MKKYIEPSIDIHEVEIEDVLIGGSVHDEVGDDGNFSKERQSVDFSDSESIW